LKAKRAIGLIRHCTKFLRRANLKMPLLGGGGFRAAKTRRVELLALRGVAPRAAAQRLWKGEQFPCARSARYCADGVLAARELAPLGGDVIDWWTFLTAKGKLEFCRTLDDRHKPVCEIKKLWNKRNV
jgi:hypothetical protein